MRGIASLVLVIIVASIAAILALVIATWATYIHADVYKTQCIVKALESYAVTSNGHCIVGVARINVGGGCTPPVRILSITIPGLPTISEPAGGTIDNVLLYRGDNYIVVYMTGGTGVIEKAGSLDEAINRAVSLVSSSCMEVGNRDPVNARMTLDNGVTVPIAFRKLYIVS